MSIKLDMSKAYDWIEWSYLRRVMEVMGFHLRLVELMMKCVSTATFSILINGTPMGHVVPSHGLRRGDPLFLYLFLLCTEGLIKLLSRASQEKTLSGI